MLPSTRTPTTDRVSVVRSRARRRGYPIHAYIGANGGGKSMAAVYDSLPTLAAGRPVVSTVRLLDPATGLPHRLWHPLSDYRTLLDVEHCDVLLDEVTGVASSRESSGMPPAVANLLVQLRRRDVALRWTAPSWKRADTIIRECSQAVTLCQGFLPEVVKAEDGSDRQWRSRRLFYWRTFDAATFDEWTAHKREKLRPAVRSLFWRPGSVAADAYDTFDQVLSLGAVTESGTCIDCGGKRRAAACACAKTETAALGPPRGSRRLLGVAETGDTPAVVVELDPPA